LPHGVRVTFNRWRLGWRFPGNSSDRSISGQTALTHLYQTQPFQIVLRPVGFMFNNFAEGADGQGLTSSMHMEGDAATIVMLEKTGSTFLPGQAKPVSLKSTLNLSYGETAKPGVIDRHGVRR